MPTTPPKPDPWENFSDTHLLPDQVAYGQRMISLERVYRGGYEVGRLNAAVRTYKTVWDHYQAEANEPTGPEGEWTQWDDGYASGLKVALDFIAHLHSLPLAPCPPVPRQVEAPYMPIRPGKELI